MSAKDKDSLQDDWDAVKPRTEATPKGGGDLDLTLALQAISGDSRVRIVIEKLPFTSTKLSTEAYPTLREAEKEALARLAAHVRDRHRGAIAGLAEASRNATNYRTEITKCEEALRHLPPEPKPETLPAPVRPRIVRRRGHDLTAPEVTGLDEDDLPF